MSQFFNENYIISIWLFEKDNKYILKAQHSIRFRSRQGQLWQWAIFYENLYINIWYFENTINSYLKYKPFFMKIFILASDILKKTINTYLKLNFQYGSANFLWKLYILAYEILKKTNDTYNARNSCCV